MATPSIADLPEATSRELAGTDARVYRRVDEEHLQPTAQAIEKLRSPPAQTATSPLGLLGRGTFQQQTGATLKGLCKQRQIPSYSKLKKADLAKVLEQHGLEPPPRPLESFSKKELVRLVRELLAGQG